MFCLFRGMWSCHNSCRSIFPDTHVGKLIKCLHQCIEFTDVNMVHVQQVKDFVWEPAILQAQTNLRWICDAPAKEGAVDFLLHHREKHPCDVFCVLWLGFGGHCNGDGVRLIVVTGEESTIVDLLQLHAVVVDHTVGCDRAAAAFDELPCGFLAIQRIQFLCFGAAAMQVHVMVAADGGEVGKVGNDRGLLAAEGQVDEIL